MTKNPYDVLGVPETATEDEIKSAYRKKAKENHPDLHPDDPNASDRMNEINEAYSILSDPEKLAMWKLQQGGSYSSGGGQSYWNPYSGQGQSPFGQQNPYGQQGQSGGWTSFGGWTVYDFSDIFEEVQRENSQNGGYQRGGYNNGRSSGNWEDPSGGYRPRVYTYRGGCLWSIIKFMLVLWVIRFIFRILFFGFFI